MYTYRITTSTRGDRMDLVQETESMGYEFVQIVPDTIDGVFHYWFRKPCVIPQNENNGQQGRVMVS